MFIVQRSDFISQVWELTKSGSVVLTGSPGVGKTWAVAQLIKRCKRENRKVVSLAAEDFEIDSVDELTRAIGFKTGFVSLLASFGPESLFIIDGLDALRGDSSQKAFRTLIRTVTEQVPTCSVVVSIRTFDLNQSPELQNLFFNSHGARRFVSVTARPFSDDDLRFAAEQVPALRSVIVESAPTEIRELLKSPFNLRLAVELLEGGAGIEELSTMHSQVQLLQKFWFMRVEGPSDSSDRKALLRQVAREMVNRKSLSVREEAAYSAGLAIALRSLRSAEVLRESVTERISFSHNILFDYAVARLLLDEEVIFSFIEADASRTIFFRPSILYFFHHLWWNDRIVFWNLSHRFFAARQLPERVKVVPAIVLTEASRSSVDLQPLMADPRSGDGLPVTLRAVQALGAFQTPRRQLWLGLLDKLADRTELDFINEFVSLLDIANRSREPNEGSRLGSIARRLLRWMWRTAEKLSKHQTNQLNDIAAARVMPIALQMYASDPAASRDIVESVLSRLGSASASSHDAHWLAHEIKHVIDNDPSLAVLVYQRMFSHPEHSKETTVMGTGGPVFTLTSNREQDFETGLYGLQLNFPYFFEAAPVHATAAAVLAINSEVFQRDAPSAERDQARQRFTFKFQNSSATYVSDFSEIWDHGAREHSSLQLLDTILKRSSGVPTSQLRATVLVIARTAQVAVCWKRLLEAAASNVRLFFPHIRGLLEIPRFLAAPEVVVAVGNVLKTAYADSIMTASEMMRVENAIKRIPRSRFIKRYEKAEAIQNRLLLCIGPDHLVSPELRARAVELSRKQSSSDSEPYMRITGGAMAYSTEDWIRDQGADPTRKENADILAASKGITEFENKYLNSVPSTEECLAVEPQLKRLHDLIQTNVADEQVSDHARGVLYAAAESLVKNANLDKDLPIAQFCRTILLQGASDPSPVFDAKYHLRFDMPSWGSPLPRIEAAQGITHLLWNYGPDDELCRTLSKLAEDGVPAVRFQVAVGLLGFYKHHDEQRFWDFVEKMMSRETTPGVMLGLVGTLGRVAGSNPERVVNQLTAAIDRGLPASGSSELTRTLIQILTGLFISRNDQNAGKQLARFEAEPVRYASEVANEIFTASYYLTPNNADTDARGRARELFRRILLSSYENLRKASDIAEPRDQEETFKALMKHIDDVASRIYFALDIQPDPGTQETTSTEDQRRDIYFEIKPIIISLAEGSEDPSKHHILPATAHYLLQTLNGVLRYDPGSVIKLASHVCTAGSALSYQFDSMAISEVVKLVENSLADFKEVLKDPSVATSLGEILDIFARAGWPDALRLTFKLDQAVR